MEGEMGRRCRSALLSLLLFSVFVPESIARSATIPARYDGFVFHDLGQARNTVDIEVFLDVLCPDSRDAWQPLKRAVTYYGPRVVLIVHPFPLPYHDNAFVASRALHIVNRLNSSYTFPMLELFFKYQEIYYNRRTINLSRASIVDSIVKFVSNALGESLSSAVKYGFNDRKTDFATRVSFKYGSSRGVMGTPSFFVNGFPLPDSGDTMDYSQWRSILDPLVSDSIQRESLHFSL